MKLLGGFLNFIKIYFFPKESKTNKHYYNT